MVKKYRCTGECKGSKGIYTTVTTSHCPRCGGELEVFDTDTEMVNMYIVVSSVGLGSDYREHSQEFVCEGCLDDDDQIKERIVDVTCDRCGIEDLRS